MEPSKFYRDGSNGLLRGRESLTVCIKQEEYEAHVSIDNVEHS